MSPIGLTRARAHAHARIYHHTCAIARTHARTRTHHSSLTNWLCAADEEDVVEDGAEGPPPHVRFTSLRLRVCSETRAVTRQSPSSPRPCACDPSPPHCLHHAPPTIRRHTRAVNQWRDARERGYYDGSGRSVTRKTRGDDRGRLHARRRGGV